MAKIYSKTSALHSQLRSVRLKMFIFGGLCGLCFVLWMLNIMIFHTFNPTFLVPTFFGFGASGLLASFFSKKHEVLSSGVAGETKTTQIIQKFPDTYSVITNAVINHDGRTSEIDAILIGPRGIFIIETKHHNGEIVGNSHDEKFTQYKIGQGGTPYSNQFYSPIKQVSTQVYRLSSYLKEKGINDWVQGIVYFSNPAATVEVEFDYNEIPVFSKSNDGEKELMAYVDNYNCRHELTQSEISRIVKAIV